MPLEVTYKHVDPTGRYQTCDEDGTLVEVEGTFTTTDPFLIRELDAATHALEVVSRKELPDPEPEAPAKGKKDKEE